MPEAFFTEPTTGYSAGAHSRYSGQFTDAPPYRYGYPVRLPDGRILVLPLAAIAIRRQCGRIADCEPGRSCRDCCARRRDGRTVACPLKPTLLSVCRRLVLHSPIVWRSGLAIRGLCRSATRANSGTTTSSRKRFNRSPAPSPASSCGSIPTCCRCSTVAALCWWMTRFRLARRPSLPVRLLRRIGVHVTWHRGGDETDQSLAGGNGNVIRAAAGASCVRLSAVPARR